MCVNELKCVCQRYACIDSSVCSSTCKRVCVCVMRDKDTETVSVIGALECLVLLVVSDL